jgi:hypothetical protein
MLALPAGADSRRIAIVVGNNAGNSDLPPLRYAESDAGKFARVMVELGDVSADDVMLLQGRKVAELERAIQDAKDRVSVFKRTPDTRTVLIFYFSGHSDGEAIELGQEKLPYARLKAMLLGTGADLRVAIVDACRSGAGFREKGGKPADAFVIKLTDTLVASGDAFITSSAADESALESNEVMGSYFTHNLISGLRGAADTSGDKLVTLAEAYRYAFDRTVAATSVLPAGSQHPSYDFRLSGQGELVLSSLIKPSATLVVPEGSERSLVTDVVRDQVIVELPPGSIREIALSPGQYGLRLFKGGQSFGGRVTLSDGMRKVVKWDDLTAQSSSIVVAKKGGGGPEYELSTPGQGPASHSVLSLGFGAGRAVADSLGLSAGLRVGFEPTTESGLTFSVLGSYASGVGLTEGGVQGRCGYRFGFEISRFWFGIGAEAGVGVFWQTFPDSSGASQLTGTVSFLLAARGTARMRITGPLWLALDVDIAGGLLRLDDQWKIVPLPTGTLGLALAL